jgi:hypothetical protein
LFVVVFISFCQYKSILAYSILSRVFATNLGVGCDTSGTCIYWEIDAVGM